MNAKHFITSTFWRHGHPTMSKAVLFAQLNMARSLTKGHHKSTISDTAPNPEIESCFIRLRRRLVRIGWCQSRYPLDLAWFWFLYVALCRSLHLDFLFLFLFYFTPGLFFSSIFLFFIPSSGLVLIPSLGLVLIPSFGLVLSPSVWLGVGPPFWLGFEHLYMAWCRAPLSSLVSEPLHLAWPQRGDNRTRPLFSRTCERPVWVRGEDTCKEARRGEG